MAQTGVDLHWPQPDDTLVHAQHAQSAPARIPRSAIYTRRVLDAVKNSHAGGLFPPLARCFSDGIVRPARALGGERDAGCIGHLLADSRFGPLIELFERVGDWCASLAHKYAESVSSRVLRLTNDELCGPLLREAFTICAVAPAPEAARVLRVFEEGFRASISLFLARLARDLRAGVLAREGFHGPVTALWANGEETHNGRQQVLRVRFRRGGALAYKPRPASGEDLFLAENLSGPRKSIFAILNELPPVSGEVRLPTLRVIRGRGRDRLDYSWQDWVERPSSWGTLHKSGRLRLRGPKLREGDARRFWQRAGSLSAACVAFGIIDMQGGNVVVGARSVDRETLPYPIDLEIFFFPVRRLWETGLIGTGDDEKYHHVGLERAAWRCSPSGPPACFVESASPGGKVLRLVRRRRPWGREEVRSTISDRRGNVGFGAHLAPYLRGMFDLWTLLNLEKPRVATLLARASRRHFVRNLPKPTKTYLAELEPWFSRPKNGATPVRWSREERAQFERHDVPYFFRRASGGPLLATDPGSRRWKMVGAQEFTDARLCPSQSVIACEAITFVNLGVLIRDAVEYVFEDIVDKTLVDAELGVRLDVTGPRKGAASFDWIASGKRLTYTWDEEKVRLSVDPLPPEREELRAQLLRLDRVDGALRMRWAESEFADSSVGEKLDSLVSEAISWLQEIIRNHGWPGVRLVGEDGASAACRLVLHTSRHPTFQRRCLRLLEAAAKNGDALLRDLAYLTDAVRLDRRQRQLYGTKFEKRNGELVPCPIEDEERVDQRRAAMGLEPLARYAEALRKIYSR